MITIKEKPEPQGGFWEAYLNGMYLTCVYYHSDEVKYKKLIECLEEAKKKIPVEVELTIPIENVKPI